MTIPAEALTQHVAVVGTVGAGKTFTAKGVVESLLDAGKRVCIIDPTSAWWGLRLLADGHSPGFKIAIVGGEHGDVPLTEDMGVKIGEMIGTRNLPAVLDLSDMLIGDRHEFMTEFAKSLYRHNKQPLHLIIDEADEFCPQNPLPETRHMLHHVDRIVRRGRIRGFRVTMITQRPATIHKNVLTQLNTLIAMRLTSPQDRKAIEEWVKGNADATEAKEVLGSLASLKRGTGWLWCPSLGILTKTAFPAIKTFDSSRSPEEGDNIPEPATLAPVDLDELRAIISAPTSEAKKIIGGKESSPSRMVEKINTPDIEAIRKAAFDEGRKFGALESARLLNDLTQARLAKICLALRNHRDDIQELGDTVAALGSELDRTIEANEKAFTPQKASVSREAPSGDKRIPHTSGFTESVKQANGSLPAPQQRILASLAFWTAIGHEAPSRDQVAAVSGYKPDTGNFRAIVGALTTNGSVVIPQPGRLSLSGKTHVSPPDDPKAILLSTLSGSELRVLNAALETGRDVNRAALAGRAGYEPNTGNFRALVGSLCTVGILDKTGPGMVAVSDWARQVLT